MSRFEAEALELIQKAANIALVSNSSKIAEATLQVVDAMMDDGLVGLANINPYAMVMNEMIATGALGLRAKDLSPSPARHDLEPGPGQEASPRSW